MTHRLSWFVSRILFSFAILVLAVNSSLASWNGGIAKVRITPESFMPMSGYASRGAKHATGTLTDLWAKALVIQDDDGTTAVLVTLDLIGLDRELSRSICDSIAKDHSLKRSQIALNTSHTHTGPVVARNLRPMHYLLLDEENRKLVDDYAAFLEESISKAVGEAFENLAPAEFTWGNSTATFAANRRDNDQNNIPALRANGQLKGPHDHDVPVLLMRQDNELKGIIFGYACHCTTLSSFEWSGDYAGFAQAELEEIYPGSIAMFWAGCGADQNPLPRRTVELAQRYGSHLAHAVSQVIGRDEHAITGKLETAYKEVDLALAKLPSREELIRQSESSNKYEAARAQHHLGKIDAGESLAQSYPYPVQRWDVGDDVQWYFLGGEVVVDYAIKIKADYGSESHNGTNVWCAGYSNDVMAYIPSLRVLLEGGYEGGGAMVYYGLPTVWSEEVEATITKTIKELDRQ